MSPVHPAGAIGPADLVEAKAGRTVSLCIPARDEAATIGDIVAAARRALIEEVPLLDEIVVVDDGSTDRTASVAEAAGARVVATADAPPAVDLRPGKGEAMWRSLAASTGDVVVWIDGDLDPFDPLWPARLAAPLLLDDAVTFVKGRYRRLSDLPHAGGGRVTELVARPVLAMLHPALTAIAQPLGGEYAARRSSVLEVPFAGGYGVDLGLLIDVAERDGIDAIVEVDLGERRHRNRPLEQLSVQAAEVLHVALRRAGLVVESEPRLPLPVPPGATFEVRDRPPLASLLDRVETDP